jgi:hypothetical protein
MTKIDAQPPRRTPSGGGPSPFTLVGAVVVLLFGPSKGSAAPAPSTSAPQMIGLLRGDAGPGLLAAFCQRGSTDEFADLALLLAPRHD